MGGNPDQHDAELYFSRPYPADEIPAKGVSGLVEANEDERAQIAAALDLEMLEIFKMNFQLGRVGKYRFKMSGHMVASVTQTCVVSLKPVATRIDDEVEAEFWPPEDLARIEAEVEPEGMFVPLEGPEPIEDGVIDIGQFAYEYLAASLDPYPKATGAQFEWSNAKSEEEDVSANRPFASLAPLKGGSTSNSDQTE